jgi:putative endonuclease
LLRFARNDKEALAMTGRDNQMNKQYYVYLMTNLGNSVLYTGVTNDLRRRCFEHREKLTKGFTVRYNIVKLVYYEVFEDAANAIFREKQLKAGSRRKKIELVNSVNKEWRDLYEEL